MRPAQQRPQSIRHAEGRSTPADELARETLEALVVNVDRGSRRKQAVGGRDDPEPQWTCRLASAAVGTNAAHQPEVLLPGVQGLGCQRPRLGRTVTPYVLGGRARGDDDDLAPIQDRLQRKRATA